MAKENHQNITKRNQLIFIGYYLLNYSPNDLSGMFGVSRQMVEKIVKTILESKVNKKS